MIMPQQEKDIYLPAAATVMEVEALTEQEKRFRIRRSPGDAESFMPGQFFMLGIPGIGEAPISISSSPTRLEAGTFDVVVRRVGNVTDALHRLHEGDTVGLRGPFGTHFPVEGLMRGHDLLFVCGGLGVVPLRSAIQYVLDRRYAYGAVSILYGARTPKDRLFVDELLAWHDRDDVTVLETVDIADPSWAGDVGVITDLFRQIRTDSKHTVAVVCGPPVMYRFVLQELRSTGLDDDHMYVSLERHMRCAVGKCGRCQVNGLYACQSGAVFNVADIEHVREAI